MKTLILLLTLGLSCLAKADELRLYEGWQFSRDNSTWESVTIPHDWAIGGEFNETNDLQITKIMQDGETHDKRHTGRTGGLPWPGKGWYKHSLAIPAGTEYAEVVFDCVMSEPVVYADGVQVGEWKNGYNSFIVEIPTNTKELMIEVNNPPASSRWYPGSGLIRPIRLVTGRKFGIKTWGNYIRTTKLADSNAEVSVTTTMRNFVKGNGCELEWKLISPKGDVVCCKKCNPSAEDESTEMVVQNPMKWSPETPYLYRLETTLSVNSKVVDQRIDRVGIRTAGFTRDGFMLNGVKRSFHGVCLHHDLGAIGAAFNKSAFRRQIRLLKELGVDSIRTSHNMPAPDQIDICDEEGIMVMAESFDMWMTHETTNDYSRHFRKWWRKDMNNLLLCHRSHPSIVIWSIGNEIHERDGNATREVAREMTEICHRMDPTRPVVFVTDRPDQYTKSGVIQVTDVPALTYRLPRYKFMHEHSPIGLVLGAETASTFSSRGCYHFPDKAIANAEHPNGQSSSYDLEHGSWSNLPDDDWAMQDDNPWAIGEFVWTGFDYLGEPTPYKEYWPSRSSYFGIFDLAGIPKDRYWLYKTRWSNQDVLHILPHWTWPGREGKVTPVYVYTTYPEAEIFINGVSQGRKRHNRSSRLDRYRLRWREAVYSPGELKVVAFDAQGRAVAEKTIRTAGAPAAVRVVAERTRLSATPIKNGVATDMPDLGYLRVSIVDKDGNVCPNADNRVNVRVLGAATFKGICNGDATSLERFVVPSMKVFHGELVVTVEAGKAAGLCNVIVEAEGLTSGIASLSIE